MRHFDYEKLLILVERLTDAYSEQGEVPDEMMEQLAITAHAIRQGDPTGLTHIQTAFVFGLLQGAGGLPYSDPDKPAAEAAGQWWVTLTNGIGESTIFTAPPTETLDHIRRHLGPDEYRGTPSNKVPQNVLREILEGLRRDKTAPPKKRPPAPVKEPADVNDLLS